MHCNCSCRIIKSQGASEPITVCNTVTRDVHTAQSKKWLHGSIFAYIAFEATDGPFLLYRLNGQLLPSAVLVSSTSGLYPAVGLSSVGAKVKVNFGSSPFVFKLRVGGPTLLTVIILTSTHCRSGGRVCSFAHLGTVHYTQLLGGTIQWVTEKTKQSSRICFMFAYSSRLSTSSRQTVNKAMHHLGHQTVWQQQQTS